MTTAQIVDASEIKKIPRKSPATRMVEQAHEQGYLVQSDLAEKFKCNIETIRRLGRLRKDDGSKRFKAPSKAMRSGRLVVWLYTPEDVAEIAEHFGQPIEPAKRSTRKGK